MRHRPSRAHLLHDHQVFLRMEQGNHDANGQAFGFGLGFWVSWV